jgi:hypothetical protein
MILALLIALFAPAFPAAAQTSWMTPGAFHLGVGMKKQKALDVLAGGGWSTKPGKAPNQYIVDYADSKSLTLEFANDRLRSIRFELYAFFPEVKEAFKEQAELLRKQEGPPRKVKLESVLIYDKRLPNIMVVMSTDRRTEYGRAGVGFLTVRYFEPPPVE